MLKIEKLPFRLNEELVELLNKRICDQDNFHEAGLTLNFRDLDYSYEKGGFRPVEISIDPFGNLSYITEFSYVGTPPFVELAKAIDFDFNSGILQQFDRVYPIEQAYELFMVWQDNFIAYYEMEAYKVTESSFF